MKKRYEKPALMRLQTGLMNKFGNSPLYSRKIRTEIDGVSIDELVSQYGSPLYVFSEKNIRKRFQELSKAFENSYPNVCFAWSYKTNYLQAICAIMHQEDAIAEVVSGFEYDKARKLGMEGDQIIFNGPQKTMAALEKAVAENAIINIDHLDEIYDLEKVAKKLDKSVNIGMRLNMDTGIYPQWSRFGFNLDSGAALEVAKRIAGSESLSLNGLHCHIGTFILDPNAYATAIGKMVRFAYELEESLGFKIEYFDLGGGLPSKNKLKGAYLPPEVSIPSLEKYAETITSALYQHLRPGDFPKLYLETGRALIDEAGYLISSVTSSKRLPDGRASYVIDAGVNLLFTSFWYQYNIEMDRECQGINEPSVIYGPLCMNIDIIDEGSLLPPLTRGTRLIMSPVGAYNITQSMQFIEYRPAVVLIGENESVDVIREAEDLSDIERRECLPERLILQ